MLLFYNTAWTFLESGAVVTDRATAASAAAPSAAGISQTDTVTECASVEEDENKEKSHKHQSNRRFDLFTGLLHLINSLRNS